MHSKINNMRCSERRRQAVQIVSMLPDNREDALAILRYAQELVNDFIHKEEGTHLRAI